MTSIDDDESLLGVQSTTESTASSGSGGGGDVDRTGDGVHPYESARLFLVSGTTTATGTGTGTETGTEKANAFEISFLVFGTDV